MVFIADKHNFKAIASNMEKVIKTSQKKYIGNSYFAKYAFTNNGFLFATDGRQMIGIRYEHLIPMNGEFIKDNTAYNFKVSNFNKWNISIELEEVQGVVFGNIDTVINFKVEHTFGYSFNDIDSWLAFNYRLGSFNHEHLEIAFEVARNNGIITYSNSRQMKVESNYAFFTCLSKIATKDVIKPKSLEEAIKELKIES